jgi:hypothetical protein
MECAIVAMLVVLLPFWPLARMLLGKGPNSIRRLRRVDLTAFFVLTGGIGVACGAARVVGRGEGAFLYGVVLAIALPMGLAAAWFVRVFIEDTAFNFGKIRRRVRDADLPRPDSGGDDDIGS